MSLPFALVSEAIDGTRSAADIIHAISRAASVSRIVEALGELEKWGLIDKGALETQLPVTWADGFDGRFLASLVSLLPEKLEAVIPVPVPGDSPVHLYAAFAEQQRERGVAASGAPIDRASVRKDVFAGRGFTLRQAIVSCLAEGAESLSARQRSGEAVIAARYRDVAGAALHPEQLLHFSARQYAERDAWNRTHGGHNWIPPRFDENWCIDWVEATSLVDGHVRHVPASYCYFGYEDARDTPRFCIANSNGCASAPSFDEAVVRGLCELVERDAVAIWWYGRIRRPAIDLDTVESTEVQALRAWLAAQGRQLHVIDLTTDIDIPVTAAISADGKGRQVVFGFGAGLDPHQAILSALTEMQQIAASASMITQHHNATKDPATHPSALALMNWTQTATLQTERYLDPAAEPGVPYDLWRRRYEHKAGANLDRAREICDRHNLECAVVELTREDIAIPTARVVVPELRHFWARLGPGRLYEVPAKLQWIPEPLTEDELNPVPMFL